MLPILVARQMEEGLRTFLGASFPVTTPAFQRAGDQTFVDAFLRTPGALVKGPWIEVKLPFRQAPEGGSLPFERLRMPFTPYQHQVRAFERLCGAATRSTLVATGTGSGKTECFMYPLLDHCLTHREQGIKAIIIYPMNALATDQARRFARECAKLAQPGVPSLRVGLYTGDQGGDRAMGPEHVITDRETLRSQPPDILLTNYKMLDFLLMRPQDQPLWKHNPPGRLRYLVVDELHTFDGAQGTDLACLIRRLRAKLGAGSELACVGTSATIGGADAVEPLREYASDIFSAPFERDAIVLEDRLEVDEYLQRQAGGHEAITRWPKDGLQSLRPQDAEKAGTYLRRAAETWLGVPFALDAQDLGQRQLAAVELGVLLPRLTAFQELLRRAHSLCEVAELAREWSQRLRLSGPDQAEILIDSLCALASAARIWKRPAEETAPFLQVRVQLWLRELRRMVSRVGAIPTLIHSDDVQDARDPLHLPVLHCRECHGMAWGAIQSEGEQSLKPELQTFYQSWFHQQPDAVLLYPLSTKAPESRKGSELRNLCLRCQKLTLHQPHRGEPGACLECEGGQLPVWMPDIKTQVERHGAPRTVVSHDCPCCGAKEGLSILGSRAPGLSSVLISELFGSAFNDDYKLIAFSDSVQDAAHRAGFFGARTYSQVVRHALAGFIREAGAGQTLQEVAAAFPAFWRRKIGDPSQFVGTFIAPNMEWLKGYQGLKDKGELPAGNDTPNLVGKRLSWEVISEFGLRSRIGRTLERSGVAAVQPDEARLLLCAGSLANRLREEMELFREIKDEDVCRFLMGFLTRARQIGAFYTQDLERYVQGGGKRYILNELTPHMPAFGKASRPPAMLSLEAVSQDFEHLLASGSWFVDWFGRCLADGHPLAQNDRGPVFKLATDALERAGWLLPHVVGGQTVWGLNPEHWRVTDRVQALACGACGHHFPVPADQLHLTVDLLCMKKGCQGRYQFLPKKPRTGVYRAEPHRLVASEHTGLMEGERRHQVEESFIRGLNSWDVNLLSATPTLEMGIDIGDLSSVLLCSVPPGQANYLQRIGRAGRRDGNALALTLANGKPHDLFFYAQPTEMMAGRIATPGVFLKAMAVLERQLIAYCFDRWVITNLPPRAIPNKLGDVLNAVAASRLTAFPHTLLSFVDTESTSILDDFLDLFPSPEEDAALRAEEGAERRAHFEQFIQGGRGKGTLGWRVLNRLEELVQTRKGLLERVSDLKTRLAQLTAQPSDEARDALLEATRNERNALLALLRSINERQTLNFFTDEGLLPNYAFPEEGVTLNSVIIRRRVREDGDQGGRPSEKLQLSFQRSAQAALGELVPDAKFYASDHRLNIDQVDLKVSKPQAWRLCPNCQYSENLEESGDPHTVCPRCGKGAWMDVGQKRTLLRLRQVYARADARRDRIGDDSDEREPAFYRRQLLVDVPLESQAGAFRLDRDDLPFGFEYLHQASFREINFGEVSVPGDAFQVAGRNEARAGFQICGDCGMVRRRFPPPKGQFHHALYCRFSRPGVEPEETDWISSLYLYREMQSEAIRILLPLADVAQSETTKQSFVAALLMGLRTYFKGEVHHLDITEMQMPSIDGQTVSQYLVIYDQVPGGTGYLKELMRKPENLMGLLQQAHDRLATCVCATDETRDGCYRCILAYRNSRKRNLISRREAMGLLKDILDAKDAMKRVERLGDISYSTLLESKLEERFVYELGRTKGLKLLRKVVNGKPGYWIHAQGTDWELEPQVELGPAQGVSLLTRPDFVLRPVREGLRQSFGEWAIYLDGFSYHWNKSADDTRKRMAVLRSGRRVWTLGWRDLDSPDNQSEPLPTRYLQKYRNPNQTADYDKLAELKGWSSSVALSGFTNLGPFQQLLLLLLEPEGTLRKMVQGSICQAIAWFDATSWREPKWLDPAAGLERAVPQTALRFYRGQSENIGMGGLLDGIGTGVTGACVGICLPVGALRTPLRLCQEIGIHMALDDAQAELNKVFEADWRGFWQAANVLQFAPRFTLCASSDAAGEDLEALLEGWPSLLAGAPLVAEDDAAWNEVFTQSLLDAAALNELRAAGIPAPEVGLDLTRDGATVGTAELCWSEAKVALLLGADEDPQHLERWVLLRATSQDWMQQALLALKG